MVAPGRDGEQEIWPGGAPTVAPTRRAGSCTGADCTAEPLVSIVLPTRNRKDLLARAIAACLSQTHRNLEVIVVDDDSDDGTDEVVAAVVDPRLRYVRLGQNLKLPRALNVGFALARGSYLTWTSDDNWHEPEAIARMVGFLQAHPSLDFVYCDYWAEREGVAPRWVRVADPQHVWQRCVVGACFLYTRRVYASIGDYDPDLFLVEDYDYWLRVYGRFAMGVLHEPLYYYQEHQESLTGQKNPGTATRLDELARCKNRRSWPLLRRLAGNAFDLPWDPVWAQWQARRAFAAGRVWQGRRRLLRAAVSCMIVRHPNLGGGVWHIGLLLDSLLPAPIPRLVRGAKRWLVHKAAGLATAARVLLGRSPKVSSGAEGRSN